MAPPKSRWRPGPGRPKSHKGQTHRLIIEIDFDLWRQLSFIALVVKRPKYVLVEQGLRRQFAHLRKQWGPEMLEVPLALRGLVPEMYVDDEEVAE